MTLTFSLVDTWDDGKRVHVSGTIVASGIMLRRGTRWTCQRFR
jgi:hypothetical protein